MNNEANMKTAHGYAEEPEWIRSTLLYKQAQQIRHELDAYKQDQMRSQGTAPDKHRAVVEWTLKALRR